MTLLILNNGSPAALQAKGEHQSLQNNLLRQLDLSVPITQPTAADLTAVEKKPISLVKKPVIASPKQTLSYINTGKASDSLANRRRLRASHVMTTAVITALPQQSIAHAKQLMRDNNISQIVIVNAQQHPLGMVNSIDLLSLESADTCSIQSMLEAKTIAVSDDTLVRDIALIFMKYKTSAFSVVNSQHQVVGIISRSDLFSLLISGPNQRTTA